MHKGESKFQVTVTKVGMLLFWAIIFLALFGFLRQAMAEEPPVTRYVHGVMSQERQYAPADERYFLCVATVRSFVLDKWKNDLGTGLQVMTRLLRVCEKFIGHDEMDDDEVRKIIEEQVDILNQYSF
jgi:hypothetical protein